jgi:hypothetical protein
MTTLKLDSASFQFNNVSIIDGNIVFKLDNVVVVTIYPEHENYTTIRKDAEKYIANGH